MNSFFTTRFCCPKCKNKNGYFSTASYPKHTPDKLMAKIAKHYAEKHGLDVKAGQAVGYCTSQNYTGVPCDFHWVRGDGCMTDPPGLFIEQEL